MTKSFVSRLAAFGLAGAVAFTAVAPASAASISGGSFVSALPSHVDHVRWRRGGAWVGAGIAAGLVLGGIAASRAYYGYPYEPAYAYPSYPAPSYEEIEPVYAPPPARYYPQPMPDNGVRQCFVTTNQDRGLGYWRPC